jgi:hypothetical protein
MMRIGTRVGDHIPFRSMRARAETPAAHDAMLADSPSSWNLSTAASVSAVDVLAATASLFLGDFSKRPLRLEGPDTLNGLVPSVNQKSLDTSIERLIDRR